MPLPSIEESIRKVKHLRALIYEVRGLINDATPLLKDIFVMISMAYLAWNQLWQN